MSGNVARKGQYNGWLLRIVTVITFSSRDFLGILGGLLGTLGNTSKILKITDRSIRWLARYCRKNLDITNRMSDSF